MPHHGYIKALLPGLLYLSPEDPECTTDYYGGRHDDIAEELASDNGVLGLPRGLMDNVMVHRLHTKAKKIKEGKYNTDLFQKLVKFPNRDQRLMLFCKPVMLRYPVARNSSLSLFIPFHNK